MIKVSAKVTGFEKIAPAIAAHVKRTLPLELRQQILADEAQPVAELMKAKAPRGSGSPHAADFIGVTPVEGLRPDEARVAVGVVDVPGKQDRGFVFIFTEFGTRKMSARPFLRPVADVELPKMLARVGERVAKALQA